MMGLNDILYWTLVGNPVSSSAFNCAKALTNAVGITQNSHSKMPNPPPQLYKLASADGPFVKLAALSGMAAVVLSAYGSHKLNLPSDDALSAERIKAFETANKFHFIHTLALYGMSLVKHKFVSATFTLAGIILFCGTCYYFGLTGDKKYNRLTPIGGSCFILGWVSMAF